MKIKNYSLKLAWFMTVCIAIILGILDLLLILLTVFISETVLADIIFYNITLIACTAVAFLIFLLVGYILFKRQSFRQDSKYFYQGKRKLNKENLNKIYIGAPLKLYAVTFEPKKVKGSKDAILKCYFSLPEELIYFVFANKLYDLLPPDVQNPISRLAMQNGIYSQVGDFQIDKHPCPCCDNLTFFSVPRNTHYVCPVCFWEDDMRQYLNPNAKVPNDVTLYQAKSNYKEFGACTKEWISEVRAPHDEELPK